MAAKKADPVYLRGVVVNGKGLGVPVACLWCERCPAFELTSIDCNPEQVGVDKV